MVVFAEKIKRSNRLTKYSVAAVAAAATGLTTADVSADIVSSGYVGDTLQSWASTEGFISLNGFADGTSVFGGFSFGTNSVSNATPLGGNTDLMIRGAGNFSTGAAQLRGQNGALVAMTSAGGDGPLVVNVGAVGNFPTGGAGTYFLGNTGDGTQGQRGALWDPDGGTNMQMGGNFNGGMGQESDGIAYFTFINKSNNLRYHGWLDITVFDNGDFGSMQNRINEIHYDTTAIPEPASSMTLLCMGAAGLGAYRRRRKA